MDVCVSLLALSLFWAGWLIRLPKTSGRLARAGIQAEAVLKNKLRKNGALRVIASISNRNKKNMRERELAECLAYIRNAIAMGRDRHMSRDLLLEELADISERLRTVFWEMAHRLRVLEEQAAEDIFFDAFSEEYARDIAKMLIGWEQILPGELQNMVEAYRDLLREKRQTNQRKQDEWISDIVYFPVVMNAMIVLLNFIYIAYFIEQRQLLMGSF